MEGSTKLAQCPSASPPGSAVSPSSITYWSRTLCCLLSHVVWMSSLVTTLQYCRFVCTGSYVMLCHQKESECRVVLCCIIRLCYVVSSCVVLYHQVVSNCVMLCLLCHREKVSAMLHSLLSGHTRGVCRIGSEQLWLSSDQQPYLRGHTELVRVLLSLSHLMLSNNIRIRRQYRLINSMYDQQHV